MLSIIFMWNFNIIPIFNHLEFFGEILRKNFGNFQSIICFVILFFSPFCQIASFLVKILKKKYLNIILIRFNRNCDEIFSMKFEKKYFIIIRKDLRGDRMVWWSEFLILLILLPVFFFTKIMLNERILNWDFKVDMFVCRKKKAKTWKSIEWIAEGFWHGNWKDWKQKKCSSEIF